MGLYDRDYSRNRANEREYAQEESHAHARSASGEFIKRTYQYFAASLLAGTVGAYVGLGMASVIYSIKWVIFIAEIVLLIGLYTSRNKPALASTLLFAFTFTTGLSIAPLISMLLGTTGGAAIVANAFMLTTVAFGAISLFAMNTEKDFSGMGKMLMVTLIIVIVASLINMFTASPLFQLVIASVSAILFSAFILYDTQNIINGAYETPIEGAVALYLDFLNLFVALLQILGIMGSSDD